MRILTVMNYDSDLGTLMCRGWMYLMKRFNPSAEIMVLHDGKIDGFQDYARRLFPGMGFERLRLDGVPGPSQTTGYSYPSQALTLAGWRYVQEAREKRFIFIEADAWAVASVEGLWNVLEEKPYVAVMERREAGLPLFNAGIYGYNSVGGFLSYDKLMEQLALNRFRILLPAGDQGIINAYFRRIRYDPAHPKIGGEYNCMGLAAAVEQADDSGISVTFGPRPLDVSMPEWMADWAWWGPPRRAVVVHPFGPSKWSQVASLEPLWSYVRSKVAS